MIKQTLIDMFGIFVLYAIYAGVVVLLYDLDTTVFDDWPLWPLLVWCGSLGATMFWYLLGTFVIRPNSPPMTWHWVWLALILVVFVCASVATYMELTSSATTSAFYPELHFGGGLGVFYLSSVLFSPLLGKYVIWPARLVRKW